CTPSFSSRSSSRSGGLGIVGSSIATAAFVTHRPHLVYDAQMSSPRDLESAALAVAEAVQTAGRGLVDREALVELIALAAVAEEHVLVVGPPGTAKSEAVRRVARALGGRYFEYLLGRFTEPTEIFGPVDLRKLREGVVETQIEGMLPDAEVAFLD